MLDWNWIKDRKTTIENIKTPAIFITGVFYTSRKIYLILKPLQSKPPLQQ